MRITLFGAAEFNPTVASSAFAGGRFDSTPGDEYAYLYASQKDATAICEALLREVAADDHGTRIGGPWVWWRRDVGFTLPAIAGVELRTRRV